MMGEINSISDTASSDIEKKVKGLFVRLGTVYKIHGGENS
jgi:hypothetical protein